MRKIDVTQALKFRRDQYIFVQIGDKGVIALGRSHRKPVANTAVVKIFFFKGICNFHRDGIGRIKIAKSVMTLNIAVDRYAALLSMQWPVVINGFQIFSRGIHWAMAKIVATRYMMKQLQIHICIKTKMDMFPFLLGTKILGYWRSMDSLMKNTAGQYSIEERLVH